MRHHLHEGGALLGRSEQGGAGTVRRADQGLGHALAVGHHHRGDLPGEQGVDRLLQRLRVQVAQVVHFRAAQHLHAVGMHEVEVADEGQGRLLLDGVRGEPALAALLAGDPGQLQAFAGLVEQIRYR